MKRFGFGAKGWSALLALVAALGFFGGCMGTVSPEMTEVAQSNATYYTQTGMWYYHRRGENMVYSTNYSADTLIPINSPVTITEVESDEIHFSLNGTPVVLENIEKHSKTTLDELFNRQFALRQIDLSSFSAMEQAAIKKGEIKVGMSKRAVVLSRGYPPAHVTPDLNGNSWRYWKGRFNTMLVYFENDKVASIKE